MLDSDEKYILYSMLDNFMFVKNGVHNCPQKSADKCII